MCSLIKEIKDAGSVLSWSPISNDIVIGSREGGGGGFDDYSGDIRIVSLNDSNESKQIKTSCKFMSIAWGAKGPSNKGIIAGGMTDGTIRLWDPSNSFSNSKDNKGENTIGVITKHKSSCRALHFSPIKHNLLASGGSDKHVYIIDLNNISNPNIYGPSSSPTELHSGDVNDVAWNPQVSHILASCSSDGCSVWDLRENKPWCKIRGGQISTIAWNPLEGLHLMAANEDSPNFKLYDLRSSTTPLTEYQGHSNGVYSISWCPQDTGFLVSCGKDNKMLLWDLFSDQPAWEGIGDFSTSALSVNDSYNNGFIQPNAANVFGGNAVQSNINNASSLFGAPRSAVSGISQSHHTFGGGAGASSGTRKYQVSWSPTMSGVVGTCSFDRKVQIISLAGAGSMVSTSIGDVLSPASSLSRAPVWLKRKCGATFGFGGKLIQFSNVPAVYDEHVQQSQDLPSTIALVSLNTVTTDTSIVDRAVKFEETFAYASSNDEALAAQYPHLQPTNDNIKSLCETRSDSESDSIEKNSWKFISVLFDVDIRRQLLHNLGYELPLPPISTESDQISNDDQYNNNMSNQTQQAQQPQQQQLTALQNEATANSMTPKKLLQHRMKSTTSAMDVFSQKKESEHDDENKNDAIQELPSKILAIDTTLSESKEVKSSNDAVDDEKEIPIDEEMRKEIICGNLQAAVNRCMDRGDYADALLLSTYVGETCWAEVQRKYLDIQKRKRPFMGIVGAVLHKQLPELIATSDLSNDKWKEILAILSTYSNPEDFHAYCDSLGSRLENENNLSSAIICYILSLNINKTVEIWIKTSSSLSDLIEKACVFQRVLPDPNALLLNQELAHRFASYAEALVEQGELIASGKYAQMSGDAYLSDRIQRASEDLYNQQEQYIESDPYYQNGGGYDDQSYNQYQDQQYEMQQQQQQPPVVPPKPAQIQQRAQEIAAETYQQPTSFQSAPIPASVPPAPTQYQSQISHAATSAPAPTPAPVYAPAPISAPAPMFQTNQQNQIPSSYQPDMMQQQQQASRTQALPRTVIQENDGFHTTAGNPIAGAKYGNYSQAFVPQEPSTNIQAIAQTPAAVNPPVIQLSHDMIQSLALLKQTIDHLKFNFELSGPEKRQIEEGEKSLQALESLLKLGSVSQDVQENIKEMGIAFQQGNYSHAQQINVHLTTTSWEANKSWLKGLKYVTMLAIKHLVQQQ